MKKMSSQIQSSVLRPKSSHSEPTETLCKILSTTPLSALDAALENSAVRVSPDIVEAVLARFRNAGLVGYRFFKWSSGAEHTHTVRAHHAVIESLAKIRQFDLVWDLVRSMKSKQLLNVQTFCIIMRKYARANKVDEALYCFNVMEKYGVSHNLAAFDGLLSALCKSGNVRKAQEVFDSLKTRFEPGPKSFSILIEGWGREPNLPRAREVFREMIGCGVLPDQVTYGIMVDVLCKAGRVDEAVEVANSMDAKGIAPSPFVFSVLVHTYGVEGRVENAEAVFNEMHMKGVVADVVAYNALIGAFVRAGKMDCAYRVLRDMGARRVRPNSRTCNVLLSGLIGKGESDVALKVFRKIARVCEPDADTYTMMIKMFCEKGDVEMALRMWRYMKKRGFVPSMHLFCVLINGLCRQGDAVRACVLMEEMIESGIRPADVTFGRLKQLLIKEQREDVLEFLKQKMSLLVKEPLSD